MQAAATFVNTMIDFIRSLGMAVHEQNLINPTILPGLSISGGNLIVDRSRLAYPGDLLHEAGHLAVKLPSARAEVDHSAGTDPAEEMMAVAWAWAAGKHLGVPPNMVFHESAYQNADGATLAEQFEAGHTFGVPMLQAYGMTAEPHSAQRLGRSPYPVMARWLREEADVLTR
jgi:hypothetical protein